MEPHDAGNGSSNCDNDTKSPEDKATKHPRLTYSGKMILAPMVKIGTTPMRLLALHYGAGKDFTCDAAKYLRLTCYLCSVSRKNLAISRVFLHHVSALVMTLRI